MAVAVAVVDLREDDNEGGHILLVRINLFYLVHGVALDGFLDVQVGNGWEHSVEWL